MKKVLLSIIVLIGLSGCKPNDDYKYDSTNHVYTLNCYLNDETNTLEVEGELSYLNMVEGQDELYLHIYPNAINPTNNAYNMNFEYFTIDGEEVEYTISGVDDTTLHIELDQPVGINERINMEFKYTFHYWSEDRIVAIDDYFVTMFFYPFVAVYDQDGWNVEPYSFRGESYFNTLGDYYVRINVPEAYDVAASGDKQFTDLDKDRKIADYTVLNARDFSFSASSHYYYYSEYIDERLFEIYSFNELTPSIASEYLEYMTRTIDVMENLVGPYYYDHFTLELGYIYGMESTGIVYCSMDVQEATIVHEVIHQWFYSMIGNDQSDEPFLDEALTTYATALYFKDRYGMEGYNGYLNYRSSLKNELSERFTENQGVSILRHISAYEDNYGYLVYYHGPTIYRYYVTYFLDGDVDRFTQALQEYYLQYNGDIATIDEFFTLLENETGEAGTKEWLYEQANDLQDLENESN